MSDQAWTNSGAATNARRANLLVIDDEETVCCLLHEVLSERGYHTEIAMTGEDALDKVQRIPFDVILSDICLPGLSGMDVLRHIRKQGLATQVILITGFATLELALEALREGAIDMIPKPIPDLDVVVRAVERALERKTKAPRPADAGPSEVRRHADDLLQVCASLTARVTLVPPAAFLAECAAAVGSALGARRVEFDLALPITELPTRVVWPEGAGGERPVEERKEVVTYPVAGAERPVGALRVVHPAEPASRHQVDFLNSVTALAAVALERAEAREEREASFVHFLEYLVNMRETMAGFEEGHSRQVADLATRLGRFFGFTERGLDLLRRAAAFHDLGKLGVDPELLNRPGPLTQTELAAVRRHTEVAERLLGATSCLEDVRHILRHLTGAVDEEHARDEGGAGVPLESRILAAAEAFVSMTSARPHRPALDRQKALAEMRREAGTRFDAEVVQALETLLEAGGEESASRDGMLITSGPAPADAP